MSVLLVDMVVVCTAVAIELHGEAVDNLFGIVSILILRPLAGPDKLNELILRVVHVRIDGIILCLVADDKLFVAPRVCLHDV
jgi:hypothetical protein